MLQKIEIKKPIYRTDERIGEACPECGTPTIWRSMPCPEGKLGCLALHYGWYCNRCDEWFEKVKGR